MGGYHHPFKFSFIIARTWKQPRCPLADEWIRKLWYIYTMEYYLAIKKNVFESILMRWMKLEPIIQSEVSQNLCPFDTSPLCRDTPFLKKLGLLRQT